jgi:hypothetical protein
MSTEISEAFTIIFVIHFFVAIIALASFFPSSDKTNKTYAQIKEDREYADLLLLNFPFLLSYSVFLPTIPLFYFMIFLISYQIDFISQPFTVKHLVYIIIFSLIIMILLSKKVYKEYDNRDSKIRNNYPSIGKKILIFIYSISVLNGLSLVHFLNYTLDLSTGKEHIVTITESEHYTSRGSRRKTNHYVIHFEPPVGGYNHLYVSESLQAKAREKDQLKLYVKNGLFGIPYIGIDKILIKRYLQYY